MANIAKISDASYRIRVSLGYDSTGKKLFKDKIYRPTAKTPKAIEKELNKAAYEFEERVKRGNCLSGDKLKFVDYIEVWRTEYAENNLSLRVQEDYMRELNNRVIPAIGYMKLTDIRGAHISALLQSVKQAGKSSTTIRHTFTAVNSVLKYATRQEVIVRNPCDNCEIPKAERKGSLKEKNELHYFTIAQAKTFLAALEEGHTSKSPSHTRTLKQTGKEYTVPEYQQLHEYGKQFSAYFHLAIFGGLRRGEACALQWQDIDFKHNRITIRRAFSETRNQLVLKQPKTKAGIRSFQLPKACFDVLSEWKTDQMKIAMELGSAWEGYRGEDYDKNFIFIQVNSGKPMNLSTPSHKFREVIDYYNASVECEEDKLPVIRLHDLRHTTATQLLANGLDIESVAKMMGHSRTSTTLDVYGHALKENDNKAAQILEKLFA